MPPNWPARESRRGAGARAGRIALRAVTGTETLPRQGGARTCSQWPASRTLEEFLRRHGGTRCTPAKLTVLPPLGNHLVSSGMFRAPGCAQFTTPPSHTPDLVDFRVRMRAFCHGGWREFPPAVGTFNPLPGTCPPEGRPPPPLGTFPPDPGFPENVCLGPEGLAFRSGCAIVSSGEVPVDDPLVSVRRSPASSGPFPAPGHATLLCRGVPWGGEPPPPPPAEPDPARPLGQAIAAPSTLEGYFDLYLKDDGTPRTCGPGGVV